MRIFDVFKRSRNKNINWFPEVEDVFNSEIEKCKEIFFPVCSILLSDVNPNLGDERIHLIQFNEDPYNEETVAYFNEYNKNNMISFQLVDGKYNFNSDLRFFDLTEDWVEWFEKTRESYFESKRLHNSGDLKKPYVNITVGGEPDWWQADETPIDPSGNPMIFITEFETDSICNDYCDKKIFLFYSPEYKLAVQIYQIT
ncbi:MAG: hypothetical protein EP332_09900 [Bacteroidetes bacterium]|nr:MAG: hypothetical protein EP332_09900 [Bacteroidota bacterium]